MLKPGYNSHFVKVKADGIVPDYSEEEDLPFLYDEIVVGQESQISPVYGIPAFSRSNLLSVIRISTENILKILENWDVLRGERRRTIREKGKSKSSKLFRKSGQRKSTIALDEDRLSDRRQSSRKDKTRASTAIDAV